MTALNLIIKEDDVEAYLDKYDLRAGYAVIETVLPQFGEADVQPAVMLVLNVNGKKVLAKTTLRLLEGACAVIRAASGIDRDGNPLG